MMPERATGFTCRVCHGVIPARHTGRPALTCSTRCKQRERREKERQAERASLIAAGAMREADAPMCIVCQTRLAAVGSPSPLLCRECSVAG
jgi:hypothetical protein